MKKIAWVGLLGFACLWFLGTSESPRGPQSQWKFKANEIKVVDLINASGNVVITAGNQPMTEVNAHRQEFGKNCQLKVEKTGKGLLRIQSRNKNDSKWGNRCRVKFSLILPQDARIKLKNGAGDIEFTGKTKEVSFALGSGNFNARGEIARLMGKTGNGDVDVDGIGGNVDIKTGNGDISVAVSKSIGKSLVELATGTGNATLIVPQGTQLDSDLRTGMGEVSNELGSNPSSEFKVKMQAGLGDLKIKAF